MLSSGLSVLEEHQQNRAEHKKDVWSRTIASSLSTRCRVGTRPLLFFFFASNNGQQKEGTEANHGVSIACELGTEPRPLLQSLVWSAGPRLQHYVLLISAMPPIPPEDLIPDPPGEFRWVSVGAVGGTSCILPDFVYLAPFVCTLLPSPHFFFFFRLRRPQLGNCSVANGNLLMFINILDMHLKLNIYIGVVFGRAPLRQQMVTLAHSGWIF